MSEEEKIIKLTIIVPVYNEEETVAEILQRLDNIKIPKVKKEVIVVDDASIDSTFNILDRNRSLIDKLIRNKERRGKGGALKKGLAVSTGDYITIQDADLEYSPEDYRFLIKPLLNKKSDAVFSVRPVKIKNIRRIPYHLGNLLVNYMFRKTYKVRLKDCASCYKVFPKSLIPNLLSFPENDFIFDSIRIDEAIINNGLRFQELPISYNPRSKGKKLKPKDGFKMIKILLKEFWRKKYKK